MYANGYDKECVSDIQVNDNAVVAIVCGSYDMVSTMYQCDMHDDVIETFSVVRLE